MNIMSYVEAGVYNIIFFKSDSDINITNKTNLFEKCKYYKKIGLNFLDVDIVPLWIINSISLLIQKKGEEFVIIRTNSENLSVYLWKLKIKNKYIKNNDISEINIALKKDEVVKFIEKFYYKLGYDFRNYKFRNIEKAIMRVMKKNGINKFEEVCELIINNNEVCECFISEMSINVTQFFRDECFYKILRDDIFKNMSSKYEFKIWSVGCANGMEPYSIAIILYEMGLLNKCIIYATDFNESVLKEAENGIYSNDIKKELELNYKKAGGKFSVMDYFNEYDKCFEVKSIIKEKVYFFKHNLTVDKVFNEFDFIICRNVFIYFDNKLKKKTLDLFLNSLKDVGILALGKNESLNSNFQTDFIQYKKGCCIYKKAFNK